jgi:hypothetical protein
MINTCSPLIANNQFAMPDMTDPEKAPLIESDHPSHPSANRQSPNAINEPSRAPHKTRSRLWILFTVLFLSKSAIGLGLLAHRSWTSGARTELSGICVQPSPAGQPSNWTRLYEYDEFAEESAERLSGAVRIPTQYGTHRFKIGSRNTRKLTL